MLNGIDSRMRHLVIASEARQSRLPTADSGLPRRCAPRNDDSAEHGFTLIELMVVIVILGLLATIVVINVLPAQDRAKLEKTRADIAVIEQGLEMYRLGTLTYPSSTDGLQVLIRPPASLTQPERYQPGGYLKRLPNDPWGRPYQYANPGQHGSFDVFSFGADGAPGGEGDNADIGNWD